MDQILVTIGILLVLAGFVIGLISLLQRSGSRNGKRGESRGGGVIIIGPIPIVFGSDPGTAKILLALSIILVIVLIGLFLLRVLT